MFNEYPYIKGFNERNIEKGLPISRNTVRKYIYKSLFLSKGDIIQ